jgi:hypothetical protein
MAHAPDCEVSPYDPAAYEFSVYAQASFWPLSFTPGGPEEAFPGQSAGGIVPQQGRIVLVPGGIPLRPLFVGEVVSYAVQVMRRNPRTTFGLTAAVMVLCSVIAYTVDGLVVNSLTSGRGVLFAPGVGLLDRLMLLVLATPVLLFIGDAILTGMLTAVVSQSMLGRRLSVAEAWRSAKPRLLTVVCAAVLSTLTTIAAVIGTIAFFVLVISPAHLMPPILLVLVTVLAVAAVVVFFVARFSVAAPAVGLERKGPAESMARSWRLVKSGTWRVIGFVLLTYVFAGMTMLLIEIPFGVVTHTADPGLLGGLFALSSPGVAGTGMAALGGIIAGTLTWPFLATARVLLYLDLRMRREGLHLALRAAVSPPDAPRW